MAKTGKDLAALLGSLDDAPGAYKSSAESNRFDSAAAPKVVPVGILVTPADRKRLRQLVVDTGLSMQKLGHEAFNLMLQARGLPPLENVSANVPSGRRRSG